MEMPPYFISNLEEARQELVNFTRRVRSVYIETLVADSNPIVRQTFEAAMRFAAFGDVRTQSSLYSPGFGSC